MTRTTHALTMNGRVHGELKDPVLSPREVIEQRLALLDGAERYSLSMWELPQDTPFDRVDLAAWPQEYIQAAGSRRAMTLEVRRLEQAKPAQYVVGRAGGDTADKPDVVVISWNGCEAPVFSTEVFSATEAAEIFAWYYSTGDIPATLRWRPLNL